jgi:small subunit ribosomal protein S5
MSKLKKNATDAFSEVLVHVSRVTKVITGGRKFSFSACVVVGDKTNKTVGWGHGKASEVTSARAKATEKAKKSIVRVNLYQNRTIHHDIEGRSGSAKVILRRAKPGTGIIAGGPMRAIFDSLGVHDIVAKSIGSSNVYSMIEATFDALSKLSTPRLIAQRRGKRVPELLTKNTKLIIPEIDE